MDSFTLSGNIVDVIHRRIFPGTLTIENGRIVNITENDKSYPHYIMPGFIDAHVHIESSMLIPSEFARLAVIHGTVATVSDPHEIGNVLGLPGVRYMIENGKKVPFHFFFGAPSCVPATTYETAGAHIGPADIEQLFLRDDLKYLSEMMNYPGVLNHDPEVMEKITIAHALGKPVDGHAPGLRGKDAQAYIAAGISTDHECFTLEEALDKVAGNMRILIREGSAAKNYEALHPLLKSHPAMVMFCSDDKHPNDLVKGHINELVKRSVALGYDLMDVLWAACYHPILHYKLEVGCLQKGDAADFIVVDNLTDFNVLETYINGQLVAKDGETLIKSVAADTPNQFNVAPKKPEDFAVESEGHHIHVIDAIDGELVTNELTTFAKERNHQLIADVDRDVLKLTVVDRYHNSPPAVAFIHGFGLKHGAIASCIAHDSHNIIAVGTNDADLCQAVNAIIQNKGGIAVVYKGKVESLPLPVAGLMSTADGNEVAIRYAELDSLVKQLDSKLHAPFMTLSFMALLVIPRLKLSDQGLFDARTFQFVPLQQD